MSYLALPFLIFFFIWFSVSFSDSLSPKPLNGQHLRVIWVIQTIEFVALAIWLTCNYVPSFKPRWSGNPKGLSGPLKGGVVLDLNSDINRPSGSNCSQSSRGRHCPTDSTREIIKKRVNKKKIHIRLQWRKFSDMTSDLTHETTDQLSNRRWNERLVHAGVGDLQYKQPIIKMNPNKTWEEYMFMQYCNKASVRCYLYNFNGTFSKIQSVWLIMIS